MTDQNIKIGNGYVRIHRSKSNNHIAVKPESASELYIYDNSGKNPDRTDDGPLIVARDILEDNKGITLKPSEFAGCLPNAYIPVRKQMENNHVYSASLDMEGAIVLAKRLNLKVSMTTVLYEPEVKTLNHLGKY